MVNVDSPRDSRYLIRAWADDLTMPDYHTDKRSFALDAVLSAMVNDMHVTVTALDGSDITDEFMVAAAPILARRKVG